MLLVVWPGLLAGSEVRHEGGRSVPGSGCAGLDGHFRRVTGFTVGPAAPLEQNKLENEHQTRVRFLPL